MYLFWIKTASFASIKLFSCRKKFYDLFFLFEKWLEAENGELLPRDEQKKAFIPINWDIGQKRSKNILPGSEVYVGRENWNLMFLIRDDELLDLLSSVFLLFPLGNHVKRLLKWRVSVKLQKGRSHFFLLSIYKEAYFYLRRANFEIMASLWRPLRVKLVYELMKVGFRGVFRFQCDISLLYEEKAYII